MARFAYCGLNLCHDKQIVAQSNEMSKGFAKARYCIHLFKALIVT